MEIAIRLTARLACLTNNNKVLFFDLKGGNDLGSLIDALDEKFPGLKSVLCDRELKISDGINIYLDGENVRYIEGLSTHLKEGDSIHIIPAEAAG
ncbi:MAG: MoaD/ThiS family protein [Proteobacteria bacterium]|nr:MoaD/ThiS family protein [Pseudomonadota bacterium]